jgi:hypothetical protein
MIRFLCVFVRVYIILCETRWITTQKISERGEMSQFCVEIAGATERTQRNSGRKTRRVRNSLVCVANRAPPLKLCILIA